MKARDNPFSTSKILKVRYIPQMTGWEQLLLRLEHLHYRAAIVGPEGSGKTTLLEDLAKRFSAVRWFSLSWESPVPSFDGNPDDLVFVDGADVLNRTGWRTLLKIPCKGLIVTVHHPMHLPTLVECSTNLELLHAIVANLIGNQADDIHELLCDLYRKYNGNLREVFRDLYDIWAGTQDSAHSNQRFISAGIH